MTEKTLNVLEYDKILSLIASYAVSELTRAKILSLKPMLSASEIQKSLDETGEAQTVYFKYNLRPVTEFWDTTDILNKSKVSAMLLMPELRKVSGLLRAGRIAQKSVSPVASAPFLKEIADAYLPEELLENAINSAVISDDEISDNASPKLKEIRKKLLNANQRLKEKLSEYCRGSEISKYLQDNIVTLRNGRYVVPVKSECRGSVAGLIHDRSSTGSTLFIEPFMVVEMNNTVRALQLDETEEIERILQELTQKVFESRENLFIMQAALVKLDIIFSKLAFAVQYDCVKPAINSRGFINLIASRHPLIKKDKVVPVSVSVGGAHRILTITGPNTGGKTVCLKTVGLFCLLVYSGVWIPAGEGSEVAVFDDIFADIGDDQSIAQSLSTFSSHIINIATITNSVTQNSLVLFDELGAGTDPAEGSALAIGIIKYLEKIGCAGIITTHYSELKEYALVSKTILNASMEFDMRVMSPTYRLLTGIPGTSNALSIAKNLGVKDEIISAAYSSLPQKKVEFEAVLREAETVKRQSLEELEKAADERKITENLRAELVFEKEKLNAKTESLRLNAKAEINRIVSKYALKAEEMIQEVKEILKLQDEKALLEAKRLLKKVENLRFESDEQDSNAHDFEDIDPLALAAGDEVIIKSLNTTGRVLEVLPNKKAAKILAGAAIANIKFDNLAKPLNFKPNKFSKKSVEYKGAAKSPTDYSPKEIHVLGLTVSEAIEQIEPFILSMYAENAGKVLRIVHGKGTGALGRGVQAYLKTLREVSRFSYAGYTEGGAGATIVEIK